jgi:peptide/nickel transport system substrate-binding protein
MRKRSTVGLIAVTLVLLTLGGAAFASTREHAATAAADPNAILTFPHGVPLSCLDPHRSTSVTFDPIAKTVYDYLIDRDGQQNLHPRLALSWKFGGRGTYLDLTLRRGVKFQDGTPFNAEAVRANIDRELRLKNSLLYGHVTGAHPTGAYSIRITWKGPGIATLPGILSMPTGAMISPAAMDKNLCVTMVGAGPFAQKRYITGSELDVERWDGYWKPSDQGVKEIHLPFVGNDDTRLNSLLSHQATATYLRPWQYNLAKNKGLNLYKVPMLAVKGMWFDLGRPNMQHLQVRKAINQCLDRKAIAGNLEDGNVPAATQPFLPGYWAYNPSVPNWTYDAAKAKGLLAGAGFKNGVDFTLIVQAGLSDFSKAGTAIQGSLQSCGINVRLDVELNSLGAFQQHKGDAVYFGWSPVPDPSIEIATMFTAKGAWNPGHFVPKPLVPLINEAYSTTDQAKRQKLYRGISKMVVQQALFAPLYHDVSVLATTSCVEGWHKNDIWPTTHFNGVTIKQGCS